MDQESLAQIQQIVTTATDSLRQEYHHGMAGVEARLRSEIAEKTEEVKRHSGVLHEDILHKLDLVVEGQQFLRQQIVDVDAKLDRESRETRALLQLSYQQLSQRVETLEHRVQVIEQRLGISA